MRNLIAFLRRHSIFLLFVLTEVLCFALLFRYNRYQQSVYLNKSSEITGRLQKRYSNVEQYFNLEEENVSLRKKIVELQNRLSDNFQSADTSREIKTGKFKQDSVWKERKYLYMDAMVINNSISQPNNYLTLHRGSKQGIKPGMVVVGPEGIVGTVLDVSTNFSYVMSLLHKQSRVSAGLRKTGETGRIEWDGADPRFVQLKDISKSSKPIKGDTVETSVFSDFPPGIPVGVIEKVIPDKINAFYSIQVRLFTNFSKVRHVFIVENLQRDEQVELEKRSKIVR
ncbi:MAG: rod shape-determining protein MreC [Bacteroidota bacterium]